MSISFTDKFRARVMLTTGAYLSIITNIAISFSVSPTIIMLLLGIEGYFQSMAWAPDAELINN
ncbi:hypothetical protein [Pedobacter ginsengiterrae]|uniref:hypothetical protein n=1 Tax=Pedobacter ginsengiterrae TaxID=871696 RepID=UPI0031DAFC7F